MRSVAELRPAPAAERPSGDRVDVILVEDDDDDALLVSKRLAGHPFEVVRARSLDDALSCGRLDDPSSCVLLDLSLPDSDGLEGVHRLGHHAPGLPIVVLTGNDSEHVGLRALAAGAQDYLVKDQITGDAIPRAIRYAIERKGSQAAYEEVSERFRRTFEDSPLGIALLGADPVDPWRVLDGNRALSAILGYGRDELRGKRIGDFTHWQEAEAQDRTLAAVASGALDRYSEERRFIRADGQPVWCALTASAVRSGTGRLLYLIILAEDVTERKERDEALREAHGALDNAGFGVALVSLDGRLLMVNPYYAQTFGFEQADLVGLSWGVTVHPADRAAMDAAVGDVLRGEKPTVELRGRRRDGTYLDKEVTLVLNVAADGTLRGWHQFVRDVTERKDAQRSVEASEAKHRRIVETANDGVWMVDAEGVTTFVNARMAAILGYAEHELMGRPLFEVVAAPDLERAREHFRLHDATAAGPVDFRFVRKDGAQCWGLVSTSPLVEDGQFAGMLTMVSDITERKDAELALTRLALEDLLTGLPNRPLFEDRLHRALDVAARRESLVAVLFVDLDRFKAVNDGFGHEAGDDLLRAVAPRLSAALRPGDTLARFGGDEFAVLCEDLADEREAVSVAERLIAALAGPVQIAAGGFSIGASIGIAVCRANEVTASELVRDADTAMYHAKEQGGGRHEIYAVRMRSRIIEELEIERDLRRALGRDELRLHYQPIVTLPDERITGFEALLRWEHPLRGMISPLDFVPIAERTGLIVEIGRWVLGEACRQVARWTAGGDREWARVAVNVSARQVDRPGFAAEVSRIVAATGIEPRRLVLEITETTLFGQDTAVTSATLKALQELGTEVVLDDFGTGYSSLSYLARFPLSGLKLDRTFITDLDTADDSNRPIVEAVSAMAQSLGLGLVGEGVETVEQAATLAALGCDYAQGYLFSRPLPADAVLPWIEGQVKHLPDSPAANGGRHAGEWVGLAEAVSALGVSASTLRRWADEGRVTAQRTPGGHRRFAAADLKRLAGSQYAARLNVRRVPATSVPSLAALIDGSGERLAGGVADALYERPTRGWFRSDRARRPLLRWLECLSRACTAGDTGVATEATTALSRTAAFGGASQLECGLFVERTGAVLLRTLRSQPQTTDADLAAASRLVTAVRHAVLES